MINVTKEFRSLMNNRTDFKENAEITFANGTVLELTEKDFTVSNNTVTDSGESNGIPLGVAVCRNIQIELMNDDDRFSEYDFLGAKIRLYLTFQLSKAVERIEYGTFTVYTPETYGTTVIITALDDMYKADKEYSTSLTFPSTIGAMFRDACSTLGIMQGTTTFLNDSFVVNKKPEDLTFRELFGYISMIAGGNARIDRTGRLRIVSYDFARLEELTTVINGGIYNPWKNPSKVDGGAFAPWDIGDVADGGLFTEGKDYHILGNWSNLKVDTDDVVITGIQTTYDDASNEEQTYLYGAEGYVLSIENPLMEGKEKSAVDLIGNVMVGGRFRQFSGDIVANPTIEFMDLALLVDRKGNAYTSFITDVDFQFFGYTSIKNSAEPALRNSATTYSEAIKTLLKAKKMVAEERTEREQAVAQLAQDLKNSSGLFMTEQKQADGSTIYYMHDKPTLSESMVVWKLTALAFGISTDGGKTYPYGFTVDGTTITRLLYAEGIDADYINTGTLKVGGKNNAIGTIIVRNEEDEEIGKWDKYGISAQGNFTTKAQTSYGEEKSSFTAGQLVFFDEKGNKKGGFWTARRNGMLYPAIRTLDSIFMIAGGTADKTYIGYIFNPLKMDIDGSTERNIFSGTTRFTTGPISPNYKLANDAYLYGGDYDGVASVLSSGGFYAYGSIGCSGQKYRVIDTEHYGKRGMNAFETAEAYFSDIGSGTINSDGICVVEFDPIFMETVDLTKPYQVQLTKTSIENIDCVEKKEKCFVVHGEPGATFDWMLICKQRDYAEVRMNEIILQEEKTDE